MPRILPSIFKDRLMRRLVSGSLFAGAFIWVAVRYFQVDLEVIWVFLVFSFGLVLLLLLAGLLFAPLLWLFKRRPPTFSNLTKDVGSETSDEKLDDTS